MFPASILKFDPEGTPADETVNDLVDVAELVLPVPTPFTLSSRVYSVPIFKGSRVTGAAATTGAAPHFQVKRPMIDCES